MEIKNYFPHDSNARHDEKLIALRIKYKWEGYGLYWALIEKLRDATCYKLSKDYNIISYDLRADASMIKSIVEDFGLFAFTDNGECFYSESLNRRMEVKDKKSDKARESAKLRWSKSEVNNKNNANALQTHCERNAKERKGKDKKEEKIIPPIIPPLGDGDEFLTSSLSMRDGIPRNSKGLEERLQRLNISIPEINKILELSNFGQIEHPVWKIVNDVDNSRSRPSGKGRINLPGKFILSKLKELSNGTGTG